MVRFSEKIGQIVSQILKNFDQTDNIYTVYEQMLVEHSSVDDMILASK